MKANELRIGNLVYCPEQSTSKDGVIRVNRDVIYYFETYTISSILLTEEWLLKFGFKKEYNSYKKGSFSLSKQHNIAFPFGEHEDNPEDKFYFHIGHEYQISYNAIDYVHQLQNLYFAITGEELKLNE